MIKIELFCQAQLDFRPYWRVLGTRLRREKDCQATSFGAPLNNDPLGKSERPVVVPEDAPG
jgi:hypothetical protein